MRSSLCSSGTQDGDPESRFLPVIWITPKSLPKEAVITGPSHSGSPPLQLMLRVGLPEGPEALHLIVLIPQALWAS